MKFRLSGAFGELSPVRDHAHNGIDLAFPQGTTLRSVSEGVVEAIRDYGAKNIGKGIVIRTDDGVRHIYGHLSEIGVVKGQHIHPGQVIGLTGNTGHSTAAHLHFGIQDMHGAFLDPTEYAKPLSEMAGNVSYNEVLHVVNTMGHHGIMDKINHFSDKVVGAENHFIVGPVIKIFHDLGVAFWDWFIINLPDIMGYGAVLAGISIILGSMFGRGGMMKPLAIFAGALIIAVCILGGV